MKTKGILFAGDDSMLSEPVGGTDKAHFFLDTRCFYGGNPMLVVGPGQNPAD